SHRLGAAPCGPVASALVTHPGDAEHESPARRALRPIHRHDRALRFSLSATAPSISLWVRPCISTRIARPVSGHPSASRSERTEPVMRTAPGPGLASTARFTFHRTGELRSYLPFVQ